MEAYNELLNGDKVDNTRQIPEPILSHIIAMMERFDIPENDRCLFRDGAQYMFNLRTQFFETDMNFILEMAAKQYDYLKTATEELMQKNTELLIQLEQPKKNI